MPSDRNQTNPEKLVSAAEGYLELDMPKEALEQLDDLEPEDRLGETVLVLRIAILHKMGKWKVAAETARSAVDIFPTNGDLYLMGAYAIRRHESIDAAKRFLERGEIYLQDEALYYYNTGCYECQMGDLDKARELLEKSIEMSARYRDIATEDDDYAPLFESGYKL